MTGPAVLFAGGGTGGHVFPALAIAHEVRAEQPDRPVRFLCSERAIDARILAGAGEAFEALPAAPFGLRPRTLRRFAASWGPSVRAARAAIRREGAGVVVTTGGFAAAPAAQAARAERVPVVLLNLDATPGKANRWIARHATERLTTCDAPGVPGAWTRIGPIVRAGADVDAADARRAFGLDPGAPTLLVTGGSQGASTLNRFLALFAERRPETLRSWQALHQAGPGADTDALRRAYGAAGARAVVVEFIDDMSAAWASADLAVARAGANTVAEAGAAGVPVAFLPYPFHKDQHQRLNARPLVDAGAAVVIDDLIEPERTFEAGADTLGALLVDADRRRAMRAGAASLAPPDGAAEAAARTLGLLAERR